MLPGEQHRAINRDRQATMPTANHDRAQNKLAENMPPATEAVRGIGQADTNPHAAISRDDFEEDVEGRVGDGVALELAGFDDSDEQHGEDDPP